MKAISASVVTSLAFATHAACWGGLGHRTVGYLAEHYLTATAVQYVTDVIRPSDTFDISDAAIWADGVRERLKYTEGWHFIDAKDKPPQQCSVNMTRDCKKDKGCVISAIANQTSLITDPNSDNSTVNQALKFLIHFIGDVHQPLHTEDLERGGNGIKVCFDNHCGERVNLHGVWDTAIPRKFNNLSQSAKSSEEKPVAKKWADSLAEIATAQGVTSDSLKTAECHDLDDPVACSMQWAREANAIVCDYVLEPGVDWIMENDLAGDYYTGAVPIVEQQITRAGIRLAGWINAIAAASRPSTTEIVVPKHDL